jgi:hypothetical protein
MGATAVDMPLVKIGKAAELLSGELVPDRRSEDGVRYYDMGKILGLGPEDMPIIGYASGRCTEIARLARIPALCSTAVFATRGAGSQGPRLRFC